MIEPIDIDFLLSGDDPTLGLLNVNELNEMWMADCQPLQSQHQPLLNNEFGKEQDMIDRMFYHLRDVDETGSGEDEHSYAFVPTSPSSDTSSATSRISSNGSSSDGNNLLNSASSDLFGLDDDLKPLPSSRKLSTGSVQSARQGGRPTTGGYGTRTVVRFKPALRGPPTGASIAPNGTRPISLASAGTGGGNTGHHRKYPALVLSDEERRLCKKEGIHLPEHYPLTKAEERELKRIRRKIRNKRSAQTSRKRKQDYIEALEDRIGDCSQENVDLRRQVDELREQNEGLAQQVRRLQAALATGTRRNTQAGTCLAVLLLSVCLIVAPSLSPFANQQQHNESDEAALAAQIRDQQPALGNQPRAPLAGRSRTLLEIASGNGFCDGGEEENNSESTKPVPLMTSGVNKRKAAVDIMPQQKMDVLDLVPSLATDKLIRFKTETDGRTTRLTNHTNRQIYVDTKRFKTEQL